jgi:hypothetical protein
MFRFSAGPFQDTLLFGKGAFSGWAEIFVKGAFREIRKIVKSEHFGEKEN